MSLTMEKLLAKGLRVDDGENLRILSEETDKGSRELSSKTKIILEGKQNKHLLPDENLRYKF